MDQLLGLLHSEHDDDILYVDPHMRQAWILVSTYSEVYIVSTLLFPKDGGYNAEVES